MSGKIYTGTIYHNRLKPVGHVFQYPVFFFALNLHQLPSINHKTRLFGYNRSRLFSLRDQDYLDIPPAPVIDKIRKYLPHVEITELVMVTVPRVLGYVFNPVTFYLGYSLDKKLIAAVAEVNNTFKERHVYVLHDPETDLEGFIHFKTAKAFHVSPFNDRNGNYLFRFRDQNGKLEVHIDIERDGEVVFRSGIVGSRSEPISDRAMVKSLIRFPLQNILTLSRIHFQAIRLYFGKKMQYFPKPGPKSIMTIKISPPTWLEKLGMNVFTRLLRKVKLGLITVRMPDGTEQSHGIEGTGPSVTLLIKDYTFFRRILLDGDIGLGEAYMYGQWETPDLTALISFLIANRDSFQNGELKSSRLNWLIHRIHHIFRSNTKMMSRKNIGAHYDLSNEFFSLFLDPTMLYSAAVFSSPEESHEQAQHNKMKAIIEKAHISPHHHVLEIGSGWGGFAMEMARTIGCKVTSITISHEQLKLARHRVKEAGLEDRVSIELCDYRDIKGTYDRIVSIEMLEAVGHEHFGTFFRTIEEHLKPDGIAVLQVITIPHDRYDAYRKSVDWIQKHIFPGGHLPSVEALKVAMAGNSRLFVQQMDNIGIHYARTLKLWRDNLVSQHEKLTSMGYDEVFYRTWLYYFSYCEAAFATRALGNHHLVLTRKSA